MTIGDGLPYGSEAPLGRIPVAKDVAERAGVSIATVSRALNGSSRVKPETREAVARAAQELGFVFNSAARALITRRFYAVGAVVPSLGNDVFVRAISTFQRTLRAAGYQVVVASFDYDIQTEEHEVNFLMSRGVDALFLVGGVHRPGVYAAAKRLSLPIVQGFSFSAEHSSVGFDNCAAALRAARYLLDLGHQSIAVVTGTRTDNDRASARALGVKTALAERGLLLNPHHDIIVSAGISAGQMAWQQIMKAPVKPRPTAVICGTDELALGVMNGATKRGLNIPADLSVGGFNDSGFASVIYPPLTTVRVDAEAIGRISAETILKMIAGGKQVNSSFVDAELIIRGTTAPPPLRIRSLRT